MITINVTAKDVPGILKEVETTLAKFGKLNDQDVVLNIQESSVSTSEVSKALTKRKVVKT